MASAEVALLALLVIAFLVTMVIAPLAFYRIIRAKTRSAYWTNIALFIVPILLVFGLAKLAGFNTWTTQPAPPQAAIPSFADVLAKLPHRQAILLGIVALVWFGGGNLLLYFHSRRLGKRWWQALNPLDPPMKDFDSREWAIFGILFATAFALGAVAVSGAGR